MTIPDNIRQWRKEQRSDLLARRTAVTRAQHRQWNEAITRLLLEGFPSLQRMTVGLYWPYRGEVDPRFAIRRLRGHGARAALPVVVQKDAPLQFREWWPGARMTKGALNLPVPDGTEVVRPDALLIPPVGFDSHGYRLGYGGGYFDRTLAAMEPQPLKIGMAFNLSRIPTIQPQSHDVPMDFILTETGIHHVSKRGLELVGDPCRVLELADAIVRERGRAADPGHTFVCAPAYDSGRLVVRECASPPCYAEELDAAYNDA
jgi:5,10-methenyltetrahydrofolate synthetase